MIVVLLLTLIPIGYGVFLLYCKINPYKVSILGPRNSDGFRVSTSLIAQYKFFSD